ncbi:MAG: rhodanese-like domain-containing protein [Ruminococcus sp.]|jgi:rhodanese-related sulfurtransferase
MSELEMISPDMLEKYRYRKDTLIIDLRSEEEYGKYHVPGARHIDYEDTASLFSLPRSMIIILYCERGASSLVRAKEMAAKGYRVKSLTGGIHSWRERKRVS